MVYADVKKGLANLTNLNILAILPKGCQKSDNLNNSGKIAKVVYSRIGYMPTFGNIAKGGLSKYLESPVYPVQAKFP